MERPFPFRKTVDPSLCASLFPPASGKQCVEYKCVVSESREQFQQWLDDATRLPPDSSSSPSLRRKRTLLGRLGSSYPSSEAADKGTPTPTPTPAGTHRGGHNALVLSRCADKQGGVRRHFAQGGGGHSQREEGGDFRMRGDRGKA